MKEIEVKYKVLGLGFDECVTAIEEQTSISFTEPVVQEDISYAPEGYDFANIRNVTDTAFLRIRKQNGELIFTLKKPIGSLLDKIEYEVTVNNEEHIKGIIKELGFIEDQQVNKKRVTAHVGEYELCIDDVEHLGLHVELEKIVGDTVDGIAVQKEMEEFLLFMLGDSVKLEQVDVGYDILLRELPNK